MYEETSLWEALSVVSQKWIPFPTALVNSNQDMWLWLKKPVPKWLAVVSGNMDQHLRSQPPLFNFEPHPSWVKSRTPSEHPNPTTKIGSKMGCEFTYQPKCGDFSIFLLGSFEAAAEPAVCQALASGLNRAGARGRSPVSIFAPSKRLDWGGISTPGDLHGFMCCFYGE